MVRELLLLQSSDWQFLITTWSARDYAEQRVATHFECFNRLYVMANAFINKEDLSEGDWTYLGTIEANDGLFEEIDLESFIKI